MKMPLFWRSISQIRQNHLVKGNGLVKHCACGQRSLVTAGFALISVALTVKIGFSMTTVRPLEAFGPTQPKQLFLTGFLGSKLLLTQQQTESFLLHGYTQICYYFS
jgi:hypothetical protein